MTRRCVYAIVTFILLSCCGCTPQDPRPEGLPTLYPCAVSIIQDGRPLDGALVVLTPDDGARDWYSAGTTDNKGVAIVKASSRWDGVPKGKFKVFVDKFETERIEPKISGGEPVFIAYSLIEPLYTHPDSTPFVVEVSRKTDAQFDVGKIVRIKK